MNWFLATVRERTVRAGRLCFRLYPFWNRGRVEVREVTPDYPDGLFAGFFTPEEAYELYRLEK